MDKPQKKFPWGVLIAIPLLLISAVAVTSLWDKVVLRITPQSSENSQLRINSPDSVLRVYIDDEHVGETYDGTLVVPGVEAKRHVVRLERDSATDDFYVPFERELVFMEGAEIEIDWLAGPTLSTSQGVLKYFRQRPSLNVEPRVFFVVYPEGANVSIDGLEVDSSTLSANLSALSEFSHEITVEKDGYETSTFTVNTEELSQRDDVDLVIEVYLYLPPILPISE